MATTKNLNIDQGATFNDRVYYVDIKTPTSLSGYSVRSQLRRSYYSANSISFTAQIIDTANGIVSLNLDSTVTTNLVAGRYVYDVEAYDANSVIRISEGIVTVNPGVTK